MKIFWISELDKNTKHKASRFEMAESLRKKNHEVTLVIKRDIKEKKIENDELISLPSISSSLISKIVFGLILFFYVPLIIRKKKIDVIIIDVVHIWLPFLLTLKWLNTKLILDIRSTTIGISIDSILQDTSIKLSKYIVDGWTTITPELKEILTSKYKIKNKKIGVWESGVSIKKFTKHIENENITNEKSDTFKIMYHGSYSPKRGIENIILAIDKLNNSMKNKINLIFVGFNKTQKEKLSAICKKINISNQVSFIPQVPYEELSSYISKCDVGIIPLPPKQEWSWESSPLKTLEYLAMKKPIIATDIPFHKRIFEKGNCGILIKDNDPESIASAIDFLYNNREKLSEMGNTGRKIIENQYTWDIIALDLEKFINTIL